MRGRRDELSNEYYHVNDNEIVSRSYWRDEAVLRRNLYWHIVLLLFFLKKFSADMAKILENLLAGVFLKEKHAEIYA